MSNKGRRCCDCEFYQKPKEDIDTGECRVRSVESDNFPLREENEWCGEFSQDTGKYRDNLQITKRLGRDL